MEGYDRRRFLSEDFIDVEYISNNDGSCSSIQPELVDWFVTDFDNKQMKLYLNISNPVYVSSSELSDEVRVTVRNQYLFQSYASNITVKQNYTAILNIPTLIDSKDVGKMMQLGDYTKNSMMFTLFVPFGFTIFMSVSMDSVWSMYLMM